MDDLDFVEEQQLEQETALASAEEKMRLRMAFGDNVAQRFLAARGILTEVAQEAVLERHALRLAERMTRSAIAQACTPLPA